MGVEVADPDSAFSSDEVGALGWGVLDPCASQCSRRLTERAVGPEQTVGARTDAANTAGR